MRIDVNGEAITTSAPNLAALIAERGLNPASVATALDGLFVPRSTRKTTALNEGAQVEILKPVQGG